MKRTPTFQRSRVVRAMTHDEAFHDPHRTFDAMGNQVGIMLGNTFRTTDAAGNVRTYDSTGTFLVGELERLDQTLNMPLAMVSYGRDMPMREDVTIADEFSSFTQSTFGSSDSLGGPTGIRAGKAFIGKNTTQISGVSVDIAKTPQALTPWAQEIRFTILELESAAKVGRPIDDQKIEAMKQKHQFDVDGMVYVGDSVLNVGGLLNHPSVTNVTNVANGVGGTPQWTTKTPAEILKDVNDLIASSWAASGYAVMPHRIGLPPKAFGYISTQIISTGAGNMSILTYLKENNVIKASGQGELEFVPMKWLVGAGVGGTLGTEGTVDRMIAYTKDQKYVRYPMTMLQRTPVQFSSIYHMFTYYCRLGVVEIPYPETIAYRDGI